MTPSETGERTSGWKTRLGDHLHDPLKLRIVLIGAVLCAAYGGVYLPLTASIAQRTASLQRERKLAELGDAIEHLRGQCRKFDKRLVQQADTKEWMQYVLDGIRGFSLKLSKLDCLSPKRVGPYQAVVLTIELEGSLYELDRFVRWLESNPRLLRTDEINIALSKRPPGKAGTQAKEKENKDELTMKLTVVGLAG